ncbi:chemokine-like receptor 1 [Astatotilapia calliptera]|uniref:chemokine-like receptor 1 n=1 Tax=Astatotilapia calliptera TaxID=8154 RepID=UPI000E41F028|nr:chemokine-like receptor 1 [Astatotilapia calliptera]
MMELTTNSLNQINSTAVPDGNGHIFKYPGLKQSLNTMSIIVYSLIFLLGVVGNGVVIWVTGFKMKKTVNTVWYLHLAVADFIFAAYLPLNVTYKILGMHWPFGKIMCRLNTMVLFLHMFASVYILVVISVDRCVSVVWPVWAQNHRNMRKASCVSLCVWILAFILSAPCFFFRNTEKVFEKGKILCFNSYAISDNYELPSVIQMQKFRHQAMIITRFFLLFVVPFTVIVSCYAVIIKHLKRNRVLASKSSRPLKIIAAIIITFFLCWAPFHIMSLIELVKFRAAAPNETLVYVIAVGNPLTRSLAFFTSCLNPLLYVFMGQDFKKEIRKSILNWLETAFQDVEAHSHTHSKTEDTSQSKDNQI